MASSSSQQGDAIPSTSTYSTSTSLEIAAAAAAASAASSYPLEELTAWFRAIAPPAILDTGTELLQQQMCGQNDTSENVRLMEGTEDPPPAPPPHYQALSMDTFVPNYNRGASRYVRGQTRASRGRGRRRRAEPEPHTSRQYSSAEPTATQLPPSTCTGPFTNSQYPSGSSPYYAPYTVQQWQQGGPFYYGRHPLVGYPIVTWNHPLSCYESSKSRPKVQAVRRLDKRTTEGKKQYKLRQKDLNDPCEEELKELKQSLKMVENILFNEDEKEDSFQIKRISSLLDRMLTLKKTPYARAQYRRCLDETTSVFDNKRASYQRKVNTLLIVWDHLVHRIEGKSSLEQTEEDFINNLVDWTFQIIIHPNWVMRPAHNRHWIAFCIQRAWLGVPAIVQRDLERVKYLIDTHNWDSLALRAMMDSAPLDQTTKLEEFCEFEGWKLLLVRIKVMCEIGCFDVALSISTVLVNQLNDREEFRYQVPPDKALLVRDMFLILLVKCGRYSQLLDYLMFHMRPCSGNNMIGRLSQFENAHVPDNLREIIPQLLSWCSTLFLIIVLHRVPTSNEPGLVSSLVAHWLHFGVEGNLSQTAHAVLPLCKYVEHIYTFCSEINNQLGTNQRNLCVELFVRAISRGATILSYYLQENNEAKVVKFKSLLASIFLQLAKLFDDEVKVCREFVLTAFSLKPDESCYLTILKLADRSGKIFTDEYADFNCSCPQTPSFVLCDRCGHFSKRRVVGCEFDALGSGRLVSVPGYDPLSAECCLLEHEKLGLDAELCEDLVNLVNNLRHKGLSWCSEWQALRNLCLEYLHEYDPLHCTAKELKHLKLRQDLLKQRAFEIKLKMGRKLTKGMKLKLDRKFVLKNSCTFKKSKKQSLTKHNRITFKNKFFLFPKQTGPINFL